MHWVFLNSATERLSQVGFGDFNGDKRCDVFALGVNTWEVSSGGTGAWTALPGSYSIPFDQLRFGDFNGDKITDIFRRAPDGQWYAISPGIYGWTALQSSSFPLQDLRFGDFNGDGVTDVMGRSGGKWAVSLSGTSSWQPWNASLSDDLRPLLIANVDGLPGDDVLRYVATSPVSARWDVSSGGRGSWQTFASLSWPTSQFTLAPAYTTRSFVGRFDVWNDADVLAVDFTRTSKLFSLGHSNFGPHSLYAY
jgi:hypothetical protein